MTSLKELKEERLRKLEVLKSKGINPYPAVSERTHAISDVLTSFEDYERDNTALTISGRVMAVRGHGGLVFIDLYDGTDKIQGYLKEDVLGKEALALFEEVIDIGDFIDLSGIAFTTKRGEKSVQASAWTMLTKSLRPLPEKWHGIQDDDERLRKRYLDVLFNPELKDMFEKKARFWDSIRAFLKTRNFTEVETPSLEVTTGGAEATPFKTHHNDFDLDVYLRISVGELWQKRLMAAGFPRTFEVGRAYRNEGSSPEHLQEFTNMEFYAAYLNFDEGKKLVQELYRAVAQETFGITKFTTRGHTFDLSNEWEDVDYVSTIEKMTDVNILEADESMMKAKLDELGVEYSGENRERLTDTLWKYCRKQISGPAFLVNHPKLVAPLSKEHPDNPQLTKTFQVILAGSEVGRAHAELNDPLDQKARFEEQKKLIEAGDTEAMMPEWEFVDMLEFGMPPTFGFGVGDRLFSFFVDKPIRETQLFPLMKPKG